MTRRDFMSAAAFAAVSAMLPKATFAQEASASPFKTVLKKALIEKRLTPEVVKKLLDAGFPGVELMDKTVPLAEARAARKLADDNGISIHSFMGGWQEFNAKDAQKRAQAIEKAKDNLRLAAAYGAPAMLLVPGRVGGMPMPKPSQFNIAFDPNTLKVSKVVEGDNAPFAEYIAAQNDATSRAVEAINALIPLAADLGVIIAVENVWNNLWVKPDFASAFVRSFKSPWVKFYLDLGNHTRYCRAEEWLNALADQIVKLHIKDFKINREEKNDGQFVPIGKGSIDFKSVRRAIDAVNYNGWVSIESSGWTDAEHSEIMDRFFRGAL